MRSFQWTPKALAPSASPSVSVRHPLPVTVRGVVCDVDIREYNSPDRGEVRVVATCTPSAELYYSNRDAPGFFKSEATAPSSMRALSVAFESWLRAEIVDPLVTQMEDAYAPPSPPAPLHRPRRRRMRA